MRLASLLILSLPALLLLAVVTVPPAQADSPVKTLYSLSLLGEQKYPTDFKHFDYVNPDAPKGGTVKYGAQGTFDSLHPFIVKGVAASGASRERTCSRRCATVCTRPTSSGTCRAFRSTSCIATSRRTT